MPLQAFQQQTTSTEFVEWCVFYDEFWSDINETFEYLARIAFYLVAVNSKEGWKGKVNDFMIRRRVEPELSPEQRKQQSLKNKAIWLNSVEAVWNNKDRISVKQGGRA